MIPLLREAQDVLDSQKRISNLCFQKKMVAGEIISVVHG